MRIGRSDSFQRYALHWGDLRVYASTTYAQNGNENLLVVELRGYGNKTASRLSLTGPSKSAVCSYASRMRRQAISK